jgi:protein CpxP
MNKLLGGTLVYACIFAFSAATAVAQTPTHANSGPTSVHGNRHSDRAFSRPTERVEARLAYIRTALRITDGQQAQWDAYANLVRKYAQDREQRFKSRQPAGEHGRARQRRPNAIERLEKAQSFHAEAVTRIGQLLAVQKPLYAVLSPEQREVADVVLKPYAGSRDGRWMRERHQFGRS